MQSCEGKVFFYGDSLKAGDWRRLAGWIVESLSSADSFSPQCESALSQHTLQLKNLLLTRLDFLLLDAHRVFVRFYLAPRAIGINLSKLSTEQQYL